MTSLAPEVVAAIDNLELIARLVVEGLRAGGHRSPFHGFSAEFQQHRPYRAGDDLKYLDWKVLARTDRLYSRQFRETTSMSVMLVLDASGSMNYPETGVSKFRYQQIIAAALAYLIVAQGDAVGLVTVQDGGLAYLPARGGRPHLRSLIARIDRLRTGGTWEPGRVVARAAERLKRRGMIIALSDFYDDEAGTLRELRRARRRGHDVAMLQVLSEEEMTFALGSTLELADLETSERRVIDPALVADDYRAQMHAFTARCRSDAAHEGIAYELFRTSNAPDRALRGFLIALGAQHQSGHAARMTLR